MTDGAASARILVVDDMATERALMRATFPAARGYTIIEAGGGEEALSVLDETPVDVVLLDLMMPGMDGYEVCKRIRLKREFQLLPIIMLTSLAGFDDIRIGMEAGATEFLSKPVNRIELKARVDGALAMKRVADQLVDAETILYTVAAMVELRDRTTGTHCTRLARAVHVFADALGLGEAEREILKCAAAIHDIGKIAVPDYILMKSGPLSDPEWAVMKTHPVVGEGLLRHLKSMSGALEIVRSHHERFDGSGYPDGSAGDDIPYLARVFQIIDVFDALSFERPYRGALGMDEALGIMEGEASRGKLDPRLMERFATIARTAPAAIVGADGRELRGNVPLVYEEVINVAALADRGGVEGAH